MVYIQSDTKRTRPHHFDAACGMFGAMDAGQDYRLTSFEEVQSGRFDALIKQHLFVGSVEFMREVFKRMRKYPTLPKNSNRPEVKTLLRRARQAVASRGKMFIKPIEIKLFSGAVYDSLFIANLDKFPEDTEVIIADVFDSKILTEWRCYVHYNKIIDARNYSGDFKIMPNWDYVHSIIKDNSDFPEAYVVDVGVLENGENVVIEFNDMWAIGNYGIDNLEYYKLLRARYFEIIRK